MKRSVRVLLFGFVLASAVLCAANAPAPLLGDGKAVDWWFVFKFNAKTLPKCPSGDERTCPFGGEVQKTAKYKNFGQQWAVASSLNGKLTAGPGCVGDSTSDPVGATFNQIYNGDLYYVVWNDQFYGDPLPTKVKPAGHAKGVLAWDKDGNGIVMQVSTPSWPGAGSAKHPRQNEGNSLGCIKQNNNVLVSQHFFSLKLSHSDVVAVLEGMRNARVVTKPSLEQIANNGGPEDIRNLVNSLGDGPGKGTLSKSTLSTGVILISKPSSLNVPSWQLVSAALDGEPLRAATWWAKPKIPSTSDETRIGCWDPSLPAPGGVEIAITGQWNGQEIGLQGAGNSGGNHAKVGVSTGGKKYTIFGDLNQQGSLKKPNCDSSQNGRGGLFFAVEQEELHTSVSALIRGKSAPKKLK